MGLTSHFTPPSAPHFGGLWGAAVKSIKFHLRRVMGTYCYTFEVLTILTQIEASLNSRLLIKMNDDPFDNSYLTVSHFLIGKPLTTLPDHNFTTSPIKILSRWQHLQQQMQHFWKKWYKDYLSTLQQWAKWTSSERNLRSEVLVLLKEDNLPPLQWKTAVVKDVHPGADKLIRVVTIKTCNGELKIAIHKLCPLPSEN